MFNIEKHPYGFKMVLDGVINKDELQELKQMVENEIAKQNSPFCVVFDVRSLFPFTVTTQHPAADIMTVLKDAGLQRSVIVYKEASVQIMWDRLAKRVGIVSEMRYINAKLKPDWEELGLKWIKYGTDPNQ